MTAQGEDILAWLNAAIAAREKTTHAATQPAWRTHDTHLDLGGHTATVLSGTGNQVELLAWLPTMSHNPWDETRNAWNNAEHIALNDPESVLRRCAADRKLLELHGNRCHSCPAKGEAGYLDEWTQFDYDDTCPVVLLLAEGYGWTEGEQ
ncbi:DUF6221 family protein [Streptomyces sp. NPDC056652]|uniref:DUF6221 family protein n=1 Tax=Streptomyces sp. NPDC056652 TaxID=3345893 RepID=UPI0036A20010